MLQNAFARDCALRITFFTHLVSTRSCEHQRCPPSDGYDGAGAFGSDFEKGAQNILSGVEGRGGDGVGAVLVSSIVVIMVDVSLVDTCPVFQQHPAKGECPMYVIDHNRNSEDVGNATCLTAGA